MPQKLNRKITPQAYRTFTAVALKAFPPQYVLKKDGIPDGFAIEFMNAVALRAGLHIKYIIVKDWNEAFEADNSDKADLIPNTGITREREFLDFTSPIETFPSQLLYAKTNTIFMGRMISPASGWLSLTTMWELL
jgi:ABC-type amino acid transport substrate-binding protein